MKQLKNFLRKLTKKYFLVTAVITMMGVVAHVNADDMNDAFNSASSLAGQSKSQGSNTLSNSNVTSIVPSATSNPPEAGYYGGVKGSSSALDSAKESVPSNNEAYKAVSDADSKNPPTTIDQNADFIQNGVNIEANSSSTFDGGSSYCTNNVVSKSVFQNYTCDRDLAVEQTCGRTGTIKVTGSRETQKTTLVLNAREGSVVREANWVVRYDFVMKEGGTISSGTASFGYPSDSDYHGGRLDYTVSFRNGSRNLNYNRSGSMNFTTFKVEKGDIVSVRVRSNTDGHEDSYRDGIINNVNSGKFVIKVTVPFLVERDTTTSSVVWSESCGFDKSTAQAQTGTTCVDPGGARSVTENGKTYTQSADCWQYSDSYIVPVTSTGSCETLAADKNCTVAKRGCTDTQNGTCMHEQDTYQCQVTYRSEGQICGGNYFCQSGDCANTQTAGSNEFGQLVAELAALAAAGDDTKSTAPDISIFTGKAVSCRKAMAGFSNCCADSGWGNKAGFEQCNSEEKAIGDAKDKKVIIKVGTYCGTKVLGVCVQKKEGYCQFEGKLAKIIQEQGRGKQLNISFGNAESPDCRGLTVAELQSVNFDTIDYSDFYSEVQGNVQLPGNQETIDRIKAKINTQVSNMGGSQ